MNYRRLLSAALFLGAVLVLVLIPTALRSSPASSGGSKNNQPAAPTSEAVKVMPAAREALSALRGVDQAEIITRVSRETGSYSFVRAARGSVLAADDASSQPETRARQFLAAHGALLGLSAAEQAALPNNGANAGSQLQNARAQTDSIGETHVKFDQFYRGLRVFGGQLVVHMNDHGIVGLNGNYVPGIDGSVVPRLTAEAASETALAALRKHAGNGKLTLGTVDLAVYPLGLLEGFKVKNVLAYSVEVSGPELREQVWVDAQSGAILNRIPLRETALNRIVYSPSYDPANPNTNVVRREGDPTILPPPSNGPDNLYHYSGQIYNLFRSAFARDSYDGIGTAPQRTVLLANDQCPNAYWDGQATNYCPDFDKDDVVAHEWGHAYTQYTHNLIYSYQSGALNESYSDIFGETVDLHNGVDGAGGMNNAQTTTYTFQNGQYVVTPPDPGNGTRWRVGEDVTGLSQPAALGILRDMWFPQAFGDPEKVSSSFYQCDASDGGGVHTNSGVPNHAYALLVDGTASLPGGKFNNVAVTGIGFVKAIHIYFRAMSVYQIESTNFPQHEAALQASCRDLVGVPLNNFSTSSANGTPSGQAITMGDCQQVANAMNAVQMSVPPTQCNFQKLLNPNTPTECAGSNTVFAEDWETGNDGWTFGTQGTGDAWPGTNWALRSNLPANADGSAHSGTAQFAINPKIGEPNGGTCQTGGDVTGHFWMDSPSITIPAGASDLKMAFEHFVQTETEFDGGNVKISVNGGPFTAVPQTDYIFNAPNFTAPTGTPLAGERIWNGANEGELTGSWGTSVINLSNLTNPGDTVRIRFDFAQDACNGNLGWFVDTVRVYNCPVLDAPTLTLGADYGNPDTDGSYTLTWTRPAGATGPDTLQESNTCGAVFSDDATETLVAGQNTKWIGSAQWNSQPNPDDNNNAAYYIPDGANQNESLTMKNAIAIPAGASAALTFTTRQGLEDGYDFGHVEVSTDGGANFVEVAAYTGPDALEPVTVFNGVRMINLSQFAGHSIKVRFRLTSDVFSVGAPAGWHIDNIAVTASAFTDLATVPGTSATVHGRNTGSYCYRVRTAYSIAGQQAQSPFSNVVNANVIAGPVPTAAVSRKAHGAAGNRDLALPLFGAPGIECRTGATAGEHQVVVTFGNPITADSASVSSGMGSVSSFNASGSQVTINLTGVNNAQTLRLTLNNVNDGTNAGNVSIPMSVLLGDTTGDGSVNSTDVGQTKSISGQSTSSTNFRNDVVANGAINSTDVGAVKARSGTMLPPETQP